MKRARRCGRWKTLVGEEKEIKGRGFRVCEWVLLRMRFAHIHIHASLYSLEEWDSKNGFNGAGGALFWAECTLI